MGVLFLIGCALIVQAPGEAGMVDFNRQIRPVLSENCIACHGPDEKAREAGLRLDTFGGATADNDGVRAVVPGNPEESALVKRIFHPDKNEVMPPLKSHKKLTALQKETLVKWIKEGAEYDEHWAFVVPIKPNLPASPGAN